MICSLVYNFCTLEMHGRRRVGSLVAEIRFSQSLLDRTLQVENNRSGLTVPACLLPSTNGSFGSTGARHEELELARISPSD